MEREIFESTVFVGLPKKVLEVSGMNENTPVDIAAEDGVIVIVRSDDLEEDEICLCPECIERLIEEMGLDNGQVCEGA